jgi:protease PrsW
MWHYLNAARQTIGPMEAAHMAQLVQRGEIHGDTQVWYTGWPNWVPLSATWQALGLSGPPASRGGAPGQQGQQAGVLMTPGHNPWSLGGFANRVTDFVGLERIEGFSLKDMLSAMFKKYGDESIEAYFLVGSKETTPPLSHVTTKWPKPWMFARALTLSLLLYFGFAISVSVMGAPVAIPAQIITGSFAVPIATLIFFFEMNAPQNVSLYQVIKLFLLGGVTSIILSLILFNSTNLDEIIGAPSAGVIEEIGKLAAVIFLTRKMDPQRYPYITNGLLFGASIGAGFAAFESAGYALMPLLEPEGGGVAAMNTSIVLRGLLAPFGHVVWTAIAAGAVWAAKGPQKFSVGMLFQKRTIAILLTGMALHFTWNTDFQLPFLIKYWLLGFVAWTIAFALLQLGLKQIRAARNVSHTMVGTLQLADVQAALRARGG